MAFLLFEPFPLKTEHNTQIMLGVRIEKHGVFIIDLFKQIL